MRTKLLLAALTLLSFSLHAKNFPPTFTEGIIRGVVIDSSDGTPLQFANITLHHIKDTLYAGGTSTGTNGEFILTHLTEGSYIIKVSYIGYTNKFIPGINVQKEKREYNTGVVKLSKNTYELSETNIVGEKVSEELHLDKKVINVSQNLTAAGGTALDVLQNQPSVRVDPDGTVTLRGSSNFTVLINGKPGVLQGADALRQISANTIENIELITNPSARYDAEGSAGIININLKKSNDKNVSAILNANSGTKDKYNGDLTANYNYNGMTLTLGGDYRNNSNINDQTIDRNSYTPSGVMYNNSSLFIRDKREQYSGRAGIDYSINEKNLLSLNVSGGSMDIMRFLSLKVNDYKLDGTFYGENVSDMFMPVRHFNSSLNYTYKFVPSVNDLAFEVSYSFIDIPNEQNNIEYATDEFFNNRNLQPKTTDFRNDAFRKEGRGKLNYTHKFSPASTFETGVQANINYREFDIINKVYDWSAASFVIDPELTNNFSLSNNVYSAFVSYSDELFGFSYMAGLRSEYMERTLKQKTMASDYNYDKLDYFPSFSVSRKIEDHQLQLSYSRRVNRPNDNLLNPFPFYSDSYLSSAGNPKLLPEYINSYELNYQKMFGTVFLSVQNYYRSSYNSLMQTFSMKEGKMYTTFENFAKRNTYGSEISSSFSYGIVRLDPSVNLFGTELLGDFEGAGVNKTFFNWSARMNTTVTITPDTRFQVSGNYFDKMVDAQSEISSMLMLSASLRQDFLDKTLSLTLQARNFLKTAYINVNNKGNNFESNINVRPEVPVVSLMLTYNFNNFKRSNRPTDNVDIQTGI